MRNIDIYIGSAHGLTVKGRRIAHMHLISYRVILEELRYPEALALFIGLADELN